MDIPVLKEKEPHRRVLCRVCDDYYQNHFDLKSIAEKKMCTNCRKEGRTTRKEGDKYNV